MLRYVSDRIDGGSPGVCVREFGQGLPGLCFFSSRKPICCTDVDGDGSGGCFSAAAGQPHHSITLGWCPFNGPLNGTKYPTRAASPIQKLFYAEVIVTVFKTSQLCAVVRCCALLCAGFSRTLHRVSYFVYF